MLYTRKQTDKLQAEMSLFSCVKCRPLQSIAYFDLSKTVKTFFDLSNFQLHYVWKHTYNVNYPIFRSFTLEMYVTSSVKTLKVNGRLMKLVIGKHHQNQMLLLNHDIINISFI